MSSSRLAQFASFPTRPFAYRDRSLHIDGVSLRELADRHGTPLYVYSAANIRHRLQLFQAAFAGTPHTVCYAVKANSSLAILQMLGELGSGFDIVSGGELERVRRAHPTSLCRVVFSGVGKQAWEIDAALRAEILLFNLESEDEIELLAARAAALGKQARFALRVNPDIFADTHPYISTGLRDHKFGVDMGAARELYRKAGRYSSLLAAGVSVHIGSQIRATEPFARALMRVAALIDDLREDGHMITHVDAGGGLGIDYNAPLEHAELPERDVEAAAKRVHAREETSPQEVSGFPPLTCGAQVDSYAQALLPVVTKLGCHLLLEPGRFLVAQAGGLLTRVLVTKNNGGKRFVITDAAMNDLIRPTLYRAHHEIMPIDLAPKGARYEGQASAPLPEKVDVVGPVCESGDFFARDRLLPPFATGDLALLLDTGAYGMTQASNYNTRVRPAELLIDAGATHVARRRETLDDLFAAESLR